MDVNAEPSQTHIFGWFNPDDRAIRVFEEPDLSMTLFSLDQKCEIVESITVGDQPFFAIGRLEELGIVPDGLRDRLKGENRL
ncbi:MAG: hypothetical protein H7255_12995 [Ramlibacter sp.]|nr:hypothetical protein [Ramlibacter sp.]